MIIKVNMIYGEALFSPFQILTFGTHHLCPCFTKYLLSTHNATLHLWKCANNKGVSFSSSDTFYHSGYHSANIAKYDNFLSLLHLLWPNTLPWHSNRPTFIAIQVTTCLLQFRSQPVYCKLMYGILKNVPITDSVPKILNVRRALNEMGLIPINEHQVCQIVRAQ